MVTADQAWRRIDDLLDQGFSPAWISTAAGLFPKIVEHALRVRRAEGTERAFGPRIAARIVHADMRDATAGTRDSIGTRRRLQALAVQGWTLADISARTGLKVNTLSTAQSGVTAAVGHAMWQGVSEAYADLAELDGPSRPGRARAVNRGWYGPIWWDDPDRDLDPEDRPTDEDVDEVAVLRVLAGDGSVARAMTPAERREACRLWFASGKPWAELERITGWRPERYVTKTEMTG